MLFATTGDDFGTIQQTKIFKMSFRKQMQSHTFAIATATYKYANRIALEDAP